jgi:hypothetical protein
LVVDGFTGQTSGQPLSPLLLIGLYVLSHVLSQWLARAVGEIRGLVYARAERRMFRTLSERLFAHLMHLPLRFHRDRQTGALSQTLDSGLQGYLAGDNYFCVTETQRPDDTTGKSNCRQPCDCCAQSGRVRVRRQRQLHQDRPVRPYAQNRYV